SAKPSRTAEFSNVATCANRSTEPIDASSACPHSPGICEEGRVSARRRFVRRLHLHHPTAVCPAIPGLARAYIWRVHQKVRLRGTQRTFSIYNIPFNQK